MDGTAIVALQSLVDEMKRDGIGLILVGFRTRIIVKLRRAGLHRVAGLVTFCRNLEQARTVALRWQKQRTA
jgi:SulP family sulfate permease